METIKSSIHTSGIIEVRWCNVDQIFYIYLNSEAIHFQQLAPTPEEIEEAIKSDEWVRIINSVKKGARERCSLRMYYHFLECLPHMEYEFKNGSFYNSEPVKFTETTTYHYYLEREAGKSYIQLKELNK